MKPTSMIFLVLSLILIFGGFMTCSIANTMAASQGVAIYDTAFDQNGDAVYTYQLSEELINKLSLVFSDVDVKIVGGAKKSYVELKNFDVNSYRVSLSSGNVTVDGTTGFLSSLIDMSAGGIQFKGLRYFLLDKPDPDRPRSVTVYLSNDAGLKSLSVNLKKGSVTLENLPLSLDYNVTLNEGNATFTNVVTTSVITITGEKSNVTMNACRFVTVSANLKEGNFSTEGMSYVSTSYDLKVSESGEIQYNGVSAGTAYKATSPVQESSVIVSVTNGTVSVSDGGMPPVVSVPGA